MEVALENIRQAEGITEAVLPLKEKLEQRINLSRQVDALFEFLLQWQHGLGDALSLAYVFQCYFHGVSFVLLVCFCQQRAPKYPSSTCVRCVSTSLTRV